MYQPFGIQQLRSPRPHIYGRRANIDTFDVYVITSVLEFKFDNFEVHVASSKYNDMFTCDCACQPSSHHAARQMLESTTTLELPLDVRLDSQQFRQTTC